MRKMIGALGAACIAIVSAGTTHAAVIAVGVDPAKLTNGYINVSNLPADGGGYQFGTGFGVPDLRANYVGTNLVLEACYPPGIALTDAYWFKPGGSLPSGYQGNKIVDANVYNQSDDLANNTIVFSGVVTAKTLAASYTSTAFIKAFAADYSSNTGVSVPLAVGPFTLTFNAPAGTHVQYGFETIGADVAPADIGTIGNVSILNPTVAPEPTTLALASAAGGLVVRRRRA